MRTRIVALALLLLASCTSRHDTTVLVDNDLCLLTRNELIQFLADVVGIVWDEIETPMGERELVLKLADGALEACGHEALDGGV